jgi:hypothetical protein
VETQADLLPMFQKGNIVQKSHTREKDLWNGLLGLRGNGQRIRWICLPRMAYLDETGIHDPANSCIVAGYLGTEEQWNDLDVKWKLALGKRKGLHMKDLRWGNKTKKSIQLLSALGPIPDQCGLERLHGSVTGKDYEDMVPDNRLLRLVASPYMMAMQPLIVKTMLHVPQDETVLFTFERQDRYSPWAHLPEKFYGEQFKTKDGISRVAIAYVPKDFTARTQPADYLAYEMAQCDIDENSDRAKAGASILGNGAQIGARMSREEIRRIVVTAQRMMLEMYKA